MHFSLFPPLILRVYLGVFSYLAPPTFSVILSWQFEWTSRFTHRFFTVQLIPLVGFSYIRTCYSFSLGFEVILLDVPPILAPCAEFFYVMEGCFSSPQSSSRPWEWNQGSFYNGSLPYIFSIIFFFCCTLLFDPIFFSFPLCVVVWSF